MIFPLRAVHLGFWLFAGWLALRVWEMNFEVSPLPAWTLPAFVFLVLFLWSFFLGTRLQKKHALDRRHARWAVVLLVLVALLCEIGLTVYLGGWSNWTHTFTRQLWIGMVLQSSAILLAGYRLRRIATPPPPEGLAPLP